MPTYEYRCSACGKQHDIFQKMSDPPETTCPSCGQPRLERLISASAFTLKGSGWYADGYGAQAPAADATKKPSKAPDAPAADAPKTEAAPKADPAPAKAEPAPAPTAPKKEA